MTSLDPTDEEESGVNRLQNDRTKRLANPQMEDRQDMGEAGPVETRKTTILAGLVADFGGPQMILPVALIGIAVLRVQFCFQTLASTGDAVRHICWGSIVNHQGYSVIGRPLAELAPGLKHVCWSDLPYNYPILSLLFDQLCAAIYPGVVTVKLLLTAIELINTYLVLKLTRSRLLSALYWASPLSIWWVSHEGQFEPLQSLFILLALILFSRKKYCNSAYLVLGLGIQVKLTAVFLLPYFVLSEDDVRHVVKRAVWFALAFVPSVLVFLVANPISLMLQSTALHYNPYHFNVLNTEWFGWNPLWLIISNQVASYGLLLTLVGYAFWRRNRRSLAEALPLVLYLVFVKSLANAQFWYMLTVIPLVLTISEERFRNTLFFLTPLLDIRSLAQIFVGPFGGR